MGTHLPRNVTENFRHPDSRGSFSRAVVCRSVAKRAMRRAGRTMPIGSVANIVSLRRIDWLFGVPHYVGLVPLLANVSLSVQCIRSWVFSMVMCGL